MKTKYSIKFQIIAGLLFGLLNIPVNLLINLGIPLYLDMVFTATASFFGGLCGIIAAVFYHILNVTTMHHEVSGFVFVICSLTIVALIYFYTKNKDRMRPLDLGILIFVSTLIISLEGAIIFTIVFNLFNYREDNSAKFMTYMLLRQNIPLIISAFLSRIPVNLIDKAITLVSGYGIALLLKKIPLLKKFTLNVAE